MRANARALAELVESCFGPQTSAHPLGIGAHGCDSTEECRELARALAQHFTGPIRVVNDGELLPWAAGRPGGIGVVVGTGSIAVSRDADDQLLRAGGWGWLLGDEASSAGLVRESVRAVLRALDDGASEDPLIRRLLAAFGAGDGPQLAMALSRHCSAHEWGAHAPEVFSAADDGSALAEAVIAQAGRDLAQLVAQLRRRGVSANQVVAGGGVIVGQARLRDAFRAALAESESSTTLTVLTDPPVRGALALAHSLAAGQPATSSPHPFTASEATA